MLASDEHPAFSGNWRLNEELSDDARERMRETMRARRRGDFGRPGGGSPGEPAAGTESWRRAGEMRDRLRQMEEGIRRLRIEQSASEMIIRNALDREQKFILDGQARTRQGGFGPVETRAAWKRRSLVITDTPERGARVTRTYFFKRDDPHLYVMTKVEGRGPVFDYQRVYDRVSEEGSEEP
jgi:hypothetical protein